MKYKAVKVIGLIIVLLLIAGAFWRVVFLKNGQITNLNDQLTATQEKLDNVSKELDTVSNKLDNVSKELTDTQNNLKTEHEKFVAAKVQITDLNEQLAATQEKLDSISKELTATQNNVKTEHGKLVLADKEWNNTKKELAATKNDLKMAMRNLAAANKKLDELTERLVSTNNGKMLSEPPQEQRIEILSLSTIAQLPNKMLIVGTGRAILNDGNEFYHWNSPTPPKIEVEVRLDSLPTFVAQELKSVLNSKIPEGQAIYFVGKGNFQSINNNAEGKFELDPLVKCDLVSKDTIK